MENMLSQTEYGQPPESCRKECESLCKNKTVDELNAIANYFRKEAEDLDRIVDSEVTKEMFEDAKKEETDEPMMQKEEDEY